MDNKKLIAGLAIRKDALAAGMERGLIHRLCHRWQSTAVIMGLTRYWSMTGL